MDPGRGQFSASMGYSVKSYFVPTKAWPTCMIGHKGATFAEMGTHEVGVCAEEPARPLFQRWLEELS